MKAHISALLAVLLLTAALPGAFAASGKTVSVSTPEELMAIADDPDGSYVLAQDIDLGGQLWTPFDFSGSLDGNGYSILNLNVDDPGEKTGTSVDGNRKQYDTVFAGLFGHMEGAQVKDLSLLGASVEVETDQPCFCGILAGSGHDVKIEGVKVSGRVRLRESAAMGGAAGLVGYGNGDFTACSADTELVYTDTNAKVDCEEFTGGIMACGYPNVTACTVNVSIYASVHGYCHNGGLVGMHHVDTRDRIKGNVTGNTVSCKLSFFEHVGSRRAYGAACVGEELNKDLTVSGNEVRSFEKHESKDYSTELSPCTHADAMTETVVKGTCESFGYTEHTCPECGYSYRDTYTEKAHVPGDWITAQAATYEEAGLRQRFCTVCAKLIAEEIINPHVAGSWVTEKEATYDEPGVKVLRCADCGEILEQEKIAPHLPGLWEITKEPTYTEPGHRIRTCSECGMVTEEEDIPCLKYVDEIVLSSEELNIEYQGIGLLTADLFPADAAETGVFWSSSDETVASVDETGRVTAQGLGEAVITCRSADGAADAFCKVTVSYTPTQWFIMFVCFGWLWY